MSHFPPRSLLLHSSRLSLSLSFFLPFQVVISGALCTVEDYVIMSQCAHNKAIHLAAEGTVSVTDISQIRKYPINFHTNPNKTEKQHLNNNRAPTSPTSEVSSALLVTFLFQLPSPLPLSCLALFIDTSAGNTPSHRTTSYKNVFHSPKQIDNWNEPKKTEPNI